MEKLTRDIWQKALTLYRESARIGNVLGRNKLSEMLGITEQDARNLLFSIQNRDIISTQLNVFNTTKEIELLIADLHKPYWDELAVQSVFDYMDSEHIIPDIVCILGDLIDFYQISTYSHDPRRKDPTEELTEARGFLVWLRNKYPDARIILKMGNHEYRLQRYIFNKAPDIAGLVEGLLQERLGLGELKIEWIEDPFCIGKLWHLHGDERGITGGGNPEYITNVIWKFVHDHFIVGHYHRRQDKIFKKIDGTLYWGGCVGYLAKDLDYARLNNWDTGFALIKYDDGGNFRAQLKTIWNGNVL
jgi:hypothetical protein